MHWMPSAIELNAAKARIEKMGYATRLRKTQKAEDIKLLAENAASQVKVEVNFVFRGTVLPIEKRRLVRKAQDIFTTSLELPTLALPELYGSKLVAAMDRQHPRDLFDVMHMYEQFGLTPAIVNCFVAYLAGHNRPVLLPFSHLEQLPAVRWKLVNLEKLRKNHPTKFDMQYRELLQRLN